MDLIQTLTSQLGIDAGQAQALAGSALGMVRGAVADQAGAEQAAKIDAAIPELSGWQAAASRTLGGAGGGLAGAGGGLLGGPSGGLLGKAAGAVGGTQAQQAAQLAAVVSKLSLDPKIAAMVAPHALAFLKERLPPGVLETALKAAPFLTGAGKGDGGLGGLGGLFG